MSDQAHLLRGMMEQRFIVEPFHQTHHNLHDASFARTITVASGKGGVGKSNIALNLAIALAQQDASVCLFDANSGLGNLDLLCGFSCYWNFSHVLSGARELSEIVTEGPGGIHLIPGMSELKELSTYSGKLRDEIYWQLEPIEQSYDYLVIDTGTGLDKNIGKLISASDISLIIATPEPTAIAEAYAALKSLIGEKRQVHLLVNQAESAQQAFSITERLQHTTKVFVHADVQSAGFIPFDTHVKQAVLQQNPFLEIYPDCPASASILQLSRRLKSLLAQMAPQQSFFPRFREQQSRKSA